MKMYVHATVNQGLRGFQFISSSQHAGKSIRFEKIKNQFLKFYLMVLLLLHCVNFLKRSVKKRRERMVYIKLKIHRLL